MLRRFLNDRNGATAVEYAIIVTVLSLTIIAGAGAAFDAIELMWADNNSDINASIN